jgi:hypothetical protein
MKTFVTTAIIGLAILVALGVVADAQLFLTGAGSGSVGGGGGGGSVAPAYILGII